MLVHDFLRRSAERLPGKLGLIFGEHRLRYAQINSMANRLANALIHRGVRRGDRVGIYLGNSIETVVGIFAVLKAGGTFVVINPNTKPQKLSFILAHCGATALLTTANVAHQPAVAAALTQ